MNCQDNFTWSRFCFFFNSPPMADCILYDTSALCNVVDSKVKKFCSRAILTKLIPLNLNFHVVAHVNINCCPQLYILWLFIGPRHTFPCSGSTFWRTMTLTAAAEVPDMTKICRLLQHIKLSIFRSRYPTLARPDCVQSLLNS